MEPRRIGDRVTLPEAALAASRVGTWVWNIEDDILRCDAIAAAFFGVPRERAMNGAPLGFFVDSLYPEDRQRLGAQIADLRRRGGPYVAEYRTVPEPDRIRWILARGHFDRDATGTVTHACGIVIDVTESKLEGYVAGRSFFVAEHQEPETDLERVIDHAVRMRELVDTLAPEDRERLLVAMDPLLFELGRRLAAELRRGFRLGSDGVCLH